jgi:hypothetical protein
MTTKVLAQDAGPYVGATAEPATAGAEPVESKFPPPPRNVADRLITSGTILTGVGGLVTIIGGIVLGVGLNENDNCNDDDCQDDYFLPGAGGVLAGSTLLGIGGTALITGVILLSVGLAKRKKMERNKLAFDIRTKHGKVTLEPTFAASENGAVFGLSGRF